MRQGLSSKLAKIKIQRKCTVICKTVAGVDLGSWLGKKNNL